MNDFDFIEICKKKYVELYNKTSGLYAKIDIDRVKLIKCSMDQNKYECLLDSTVVGNTMYVEYNYDISTSLLDEYVYQKSLNNTYKI